MAYSIIDNPNGTFTAIIHLERGNRRTRTHEDRATIENWALRMEAARRQPKAMRRAHTALLLEEIPDTRRKPGGAV